jgi:hypothetical protein
MWSIPASLNSVSRHKPKEKTQCQSGGRDDLHAEAVQREDDEHGNK